MSKVKVTNMISNRVSVVVPDLRFNRAWPAKGASVMIEKETLEELMYDVGFANMLKYGILYIDDMQTKKDLGLEPDEAEEPTNIIVLTDREKEQWLSPKLSLVGFKDKVSKLSKPQLEELAEYAIEKKLLDVDKSKVLKEACGRDILRAVQLLEQDQEA